VKGGHPPVGLRLLLWAAAVTVVLLLRPTRPAEVVLLIGVVLGGTAVGRLPRHGRRAVLAVTLTLLLPALLLLRLVSWGPALFTLAVHTSAIVALTVTLTGTLRPGELEGVLAGRWWPPTLRALLVQILRGVPLLARETAGIARAVAVRRGSGGFRTGLRLAAALPTVWLPRVLARAERTARAAEVRGWTGREEPTR